MGGADNICSDKTGTLTKNLMTVTRMFVQERTVDKIEPKMLNKDIAEILSKLICFNSNANPIIQEVDGVRTIDQIGNKTDCALLELAYILGFDFRKIRNSDQVIKIYPFSSETKSMTSIINDNKKVMIFSKGAPDFLLKNCGFYLNTEGKPIPINEGFKQTLTGKLKEFADGCLRTILLAYREGKN